MALQKRNSFPAKIKLKDYRFEFHQIAIRCVLLSLEVYKTDTDNNHYCFSLKYSFLQDGRSSRCF